MSGRRRDYVEEYLYGPFRSNAPKQRLALYETMYMRILTEFATNRFKWKNLPDEIDRRFVEYELFRHALVVFFHDDKDFNRYFALRGSGVGKWNMYDNPVTFNAIGNTMINRRLKAGIECIPIWSNTVRVPDWDLVLLQSTKLAEIERTIEINLMAMRKPFMFAVEDTERLTFTNLWRQFQEGEPVIFGTQLLGDSLENKVKMFDMKIDKDLVINLQLAKAKIWNETMTFLGINNSNQDKRERLVVDEVGANDQQVSAARNSAMGARKYAVEQINAKYGLSVEVEWNEDELIENTSDGPMGNSAGGSGGSVADIMSGRSKN